MTAVLFVGTAVASAAPLSKTKFIAKADATCARDEKAIGTRLDEVLGPTLPTNATPAQLRRLARILARGIRAELRKIERLGITSGDQAEVARLADDPSTLFTASSRGPGTSSALAKAYGFRHCGQD